MPAASARSVIASLKEEYFNLLKGSMVFRLELKAIRVKAELIWFFDKRVFRGREREGYNPAVEGCSHMIS
jgi:hypothetical protein